MAIPALPMRRGRPEAYYAGFPDRKGCNAIFRRSTWNIAMFPRFAAAGAGATRARVLSVFVPGRSTGRHLGRPQGGLPAVARPSKFSADRIPRHPDGGVPAGPRRCPGSSWIGSPGPAARAPASGGRSSFQVSLRVGSRGPTLRGWARWWSPQVAEPEPEPRLERVSDPTPGCTMYAPTGEPGIPDRFDLEAGGRGWRAAGRVRSRPGRAWISSGRRFDVTLTGHPA